jgi:hypothetical protein
MKDGAGGADPTRVDRIGPVGALGLDTSSAGLCLCGPVTPACAFFAGAGLLLMGILFTVICVPEGRRESAGLAVGLRTPPCTWAPGSPPWSTRTATCSAWSSE